MDDSIKGAKSYEVVRDAVLREAPAAEALWRKTELRRQMALLFAGMRKKAGYSQREIAERAGWDKAFVSRLESPLSGMPDSETVIRFADACGVQAGLLIYTEDAAEHVHVRDVLALNAPLKSGAFERLRDADIAVATLEPAAAEDDEVAAMVDDEEAPEAPGGSGD